MATLAAIETGIKTALGAYVAGTALWGQRIWANIAPLKTADPYVVYQYQSGGDTNEAPGRIFDCEYRIECDSKDLATARTGAGHIEACLHDGTLSVSGWSPIAVTQTRSFAIQETEESVQWFRYGGYYRIRITA